MIKKKNWCSLFINSFLAFYLLMPTYSYSAAKQPTSSNAASQTTTLIVKKVPLVVNGQTVIVYRIEQPDGTWGFRGVQGNEFDAIVKNETDKPTTIHWHGLVVPNNQDGIPYITQPPIPPGGQYHYHFKLLQSGTYWMHSHVDMQIQEFLSAPMIIADPHDQSTDKEVTFFLADYTHKNPELILKDLRSQGMSMSRTMPSMKMSSSPKPDLNDVDYDAFLTNYRTLSNPEIVHVSPGQTVRLRIIDGSAGTNFNVYTGALVGTLIAADGANIKPIQEHQFQVAIGQRLDILVHIPINQTGTYPILAQGEGTQKRTGLILTTATSTVPTITQQTKGVAPALNYQQELKMHAMHPLPIKTPGQIIRFTLNGEMIKYIWTINHQAWPAITPTTLKNNNRIEMVFVNDSGMAHPMHLHGHVFEVTEINGKPIKDGALHDTILVLPHTTVKVQFDANNPGNWMMHCHMLYHQESGMMTLLDYPGTKIPPLSSLKQM